MLVSVDICQQIGMNLQRLRRSKGWSQEQLAFESGLHRTYVSGIESGRRNPTALILARLAAALKVKPSDLLDESAPLKVRKKKMGRVR